MELVRQLAGLSVSHVRQFRDDDSYIDRLSHRYTTTICVVFAILVTTKQYAGKRDRLIIRCICILLLGDPIDCWVSYFIDEMLIFSLSFDGLGTGTIQTIV